MKRWPIAYAAVVVWADENSDLLDPASWTMTNAVEFDSSWPDPAWECTSPDGWRVMLLKILMVKWSY